jgi:hypothetical protein
LFLFVVVVVVVVLPSLSSFNTLNYMYIV